MHSRVRSVWTLIAILLATASLGAHHYSAALFELSKTVKLTGTLKSVDWRNPHIEFMVDVTGPEGTEAWKIETNAPNWFRSRNIPRANFENAINHSIKVEAAPSKDGSLNGLLQKITFPDGSSVAMADARTQ